MGDVKKIVFSVINFLNGQLKDGGLSEESRESLEVAVQCLETSFGVSAADTHLDVGKSLTELFTEQATSSKKSTASEATPTARAPEATAEQKERAEKLKNEGNIAVREDRIHEAVDKYTQAIELDGNNAAYFSNRAAAHTKLGNYETAVADAERALQLDSGYTKAHSRMALAYAGLNRFPEAQTAIKRALQLEPDNESYQNNLRAIEAKMNETNTGGAGMFGGMMPPGMAGFNLEGMMSNPALMNMASQMMQDPNMQQMMSSLMSGGLGGAGGMVGGGMVGGGMAGATTTGAAPSNGAPAGEAGGFEALLQAGQRLAEQVRSTNPELIDQLREQMGGPQPPADQQPPPGNS